MTPWERAPVGGSWTVGLEFETDPGWHVYWKNSGDAGYPPALDPSPTPAATAAEMSWPAPERYELPGDLVAFGYEEHVVYPVRLSFDEAALARAAAEGGAPFLLAADVDYLVCEVDCIPYAYRLEVEQPLAAPGEAGVPDPDAAALLERWRGRVPGSAEEAGVETAGVVDLADPERPALLVRFRGLGAVPEPEPVPGPGPAAGPDLFLEVSDTFDAGRPERLEAPEGELRFRVPLSFRVRPEAPPEEARFAWTLVWPEAEAAAGARQDGQAEDGPVEGRAGESEAAQEIRPAGAGAAPSATVPRPLAVAVEARRTVAVRTDGGGWDALAAAEGQPAPGRSPRPGLLALLLSAFLGGLLLHLAPGVLPVTVVRLAELPASGAVRRGALLTAAGAVAGALLLLPLAAAAHAAGRAASWGAQLQEPVPVALLALAATLVALNLWGFLRWPLRPSASLASAPATSPSPRAAEGGRSRAAADLRALLAGLAAVVLGLAWNLPPLARSLGPALAPDAGLPAALMALLGLGLGLALPFLAAAAAPQSLARLAPPATPEGAHRRSRLAEALAFVELGAVLWLLYLLSRQVAGEGLAFVQLALLGVALAAWWRHAAGRPATRAVAAALLVVLAVTSVWLAGTYRIGGGL